MLDTNLPVASKSCVHSLNFILVNFPSAADLFSSGDSESFLPGADSAISAPGTVSEAS